MGYDEFACNEYNRLTRRRFLGASALTVGAAMLSPAWMPRVALARHHASSVRDVVIVLYMRGGFDALSAFVPYELAYQSGRPTLAVPRHDNLARPFNERCLFLDSPSNGVSFGLNPNLGRLLTPYNDGRLLVVHGCGSTNTTRSHFDAQKVMEVGQSGLPIFTGWLGRHLASINPSTAGSTMRAMGLSGGMARSLFGAPDTLAVPSLSEFILVGDTVTTAARRAALLDMYDSFGPSMSGIAQSTVETIDLLGTVNAAAYVPTLPASVAYPADTLGLAFKQTAALLKAQVGVEAVAIDSLGWDTHANQGPVTINGGGPTTMATLLKSVAATLEAFYVDMQGAPGVSYTVVAMSEFGRRLNQNSGLGVDHGWGTSMMLMGQSVLGGRVLANWPGLSVGQLFEGIDLQVTIDYRDILAEVIQGRLGNGANLGSIFPEYAPNLRGVLRP